MPVITAIVCVVFAVGGRWAQLNPERVVPKGQFVGPNTAGARLFRLQVAILGTVAVFAGTSGAVFSVLSLLTVRSLFLTLAVKLIGAVAGTLVAIHVRKEARNRPEYVGSGPYGWWP
jgi:hypothetical protein